MEAITKVISIILTEALIKKNNWKNCNACCNSAIFRDATCKSLVKWRDSLPLRNAGQIHLMQTAFVWSKKKQLKHEQHFWTKSSPSVCLWVTTVCFHRRWGLYPTPCFTRLPHGVPLVPQTLGLYSVGWRQRFVEYSGGFFDIYPINRISTALVIILKCTDPAIVL